MVIFVNKYSLEKKTIKALGGQVGIYEGHSQVFNPFSFPEKWFTDSSSS